MKRLSLIVGLLALVCAGCATGPVPMPVAEPGWQERHAASEAAREAVRFGDIPLPDAWTAAAVQTVPVAIGNADLEAGTGALIYRGGVQITSDFNRLHGLSDIAFEDAEQFYAVSDEGLMVRGRVVLDASGQLVGVEAVRTRPLMDPEGRPLLPKMLADAEGIALLPGGEALISFERVHRVWRYDRATGRYLGERVIPDQVFAENEGMEALSWAGGTDFWAGGEGGGLWLCHIAGCEEREAPPAVAPTDGELRATGLTMLDGTVFGLRRAFHADIVSNTLKLSVVTPGQGERELAILERPATVDNFEGIAAVRRPDGGVRLYIISDDNFSSRQRTLLLAFDVR